MASSSSTFSSVVDLQAWLRTEQEMKRVEHEREDAAWPREVEAQIRRLEMAEMLQLVRACPEEQEEALQAARKREK